MAASTAPRSSHIIAASSGSCSTASPIAAAQYRITTPYDGAAMGPVAIAGPTCDGADIMYEKSNYRLPLALRCGDHVELLSAGAYVTAYASQRFNGFAPLAEHYL